MSFLRANTAVYLFSYGLKDQRRHGEAGSVNLALVEIERNRVAQILAKYKPSDQLNFDETAWYPL